MEKSGVKLFCLIAALSAVAQVGATPVDGIKKALQPLTGKSPSETESVEIRDKWAVLIGCNRFSDASIPPLKFASKNAADIARTLKDPELGRFAPDHVLLLNGPDATQDAVNQGLEGWLLKKALPADLIVVYISSRIFPADDGSPLICVSDSSVDKPESALNLYELLRTIKQRTRCEHIICMLDTQPLDRAGTGSSDKHSTKDLKWLSTSGVTVLAANELFKPSFDDVSKLQSRFAHYFVEGMKQSAGAVPFYALAEFIWQNIKSDVSKASGQEQSPSLVLSSQQSVTAAVPLGLPVKSSNTLQSVAVGHPLDQLSMSRPDIVAPKSGPGRKTATFAPPTQQKPPVKAQDDDDSDINPNLDFGPYMAKMKQFIHSKWQPPKGLESRRVSVIFSILRDGTISNAEIVESSGSQDVDKSALAALEAASPLEALPQGAPRSVDIRYVFDWKTTSKSQASGK